MSDGAEHFRCVTSHLSMSIQLKDQVVFHYKVYKWAERKRKSRTVLP